MKRPYSILTGAVLVALTAGPVAAQVNPDDTRNGPKVLQAFRAAAHKPSASVVRVLADGQEVTLGTIVSADGWILTKWDELKYKAYFTCRLPDGKQVPAQLVGVHHSYDLAMLKVEASGLTPIEWRRSPEARVGKWVISVGAAPTPRAAVGGVAPLRDVAELMLGPEPVGVGVVSVGTRKYKPGDQPPKYLNPKAGWLGVGLAEAAGGAKITQVAAKSPAEKAGLKVNDVIVMAAGRKVIDFESFSNTIQRHKPNEEVVLKVKRGKEQLEVKAVLGKIPTINLGNPQEYMGSELSHRRGLFPAILQHDTVLKPKDCGGPLVDLDGKAVGVNVSRAGRTETYAVPAEDVMSLLADLKSGRLAPRDDATPVATVPADAALVLRNGSSLLATDKLDQQRKGGQHTKVYEVHLSAGAAYYIDMDSADFDPYLVLEDASGKKVAEDNNSGENLNARVVFTPAADGVYRVIATSFAAGETGTFTLTVRRRAEAKPVSSPK